MLAMLGDFMFEMGKTQFDQLNEEINFKWAKHERVQNYVHHVPTGEHEHLIQVSGKLILQNIGSLDRFIAIAKEKRAVLLTFGSGVAYWVTIHKINTSKQRFLPTGESLKGEFSAELERYFYD